MNLRAYGNAGEDAACAYLKRKGYKILDRNVRMGPGEIDIIAQKRECIAIVEVKRRRNDRYGTPAEAVTPLKQRRIVGTAQLYLQAHQLQDAAVRFDIIEITVEGIRHIEGAFDAEPR